MHSFFKWPVLVTLLIVNVYNAGAQTESTIFYSDPTAPVGSKTLTMPSSVKPILDTWMRDTYITFGPDGFYYMTGTVTKPQGEKGIYLWRSADMKDWTDIGCIWSMDKDATWQKNWRPAR